MVFRNAICYRIHMRILGIDYGAKRIGVAVSDESATFALPLAVIHNTDGAAAEIAAMARENGVDTAVMGESRDYKQQPNTIYDSSMSFKAELERESLTVILEPEFMTSVAAARFQGKNDMHDASAAALILQSYLDKKK